MPPASKHPHTTLRGVVLRSNPSGDNDLILHVLTPDQGKLSIISKRGRSGGKGASTRLEILDRGEFELTQGRGGIPAIRLFKPGTGWLKIRGELDKTVLAYLMCEAFDRLIPEDHPDGQDYHEPLVLALDALDSADDFKSCCKAAFYGLLGLAVSAGIADPEQYTPSRNSLLRLMRLIEEHSRRGLMIRAEVEKILDRLEPRSTAEKP